MGPQTARCPPEPLRYARSVPTLRLAGGSDEPDDAELLARARARDGQAFRALFVRHGPAVRRLLGALFRDAHAADEATQETFVRAHGALDKVRDPARLRAWLLGIARIVWLDEAERHRQEARIPLHIDRGEERLASSAESQFLHAEADRALAGALARLGPERRTALLLRLDQGLGYGEIAESLGWPLHKVKNEIHRARLEIRDELLAYLRGAP
jgi:RNA polymerase sigma-70 factor (ECF subfamily)